MKQVLINDISVRIRFDISPHPSNFPLNTAANSYPGPLSGASSLQFPLKHSRKLISRTTFGNSPIREGIGHLMTPRRKRIRQLLEVGGV
jgi:hypothetical protein